MSDVQVILVLLVQEKAMGQGLMDLYSNKYNGLNES